MSRKLYVGNLPFSLNDKSLADLFAEVGLVQSAKVIIDRDTGRSKGFGFVEMDSPALAKDAIQKFNGFSHLGRALKVSEAQERAREPRSEAQMMGF